MEKLRIDDERTHEIKADSAVEIVDGCSPTIVIRPERRIGISLLAGRGCRIKLFSIQEGEASATVETELGDDSTIKSFALWTGSAHASFRTTLRGDRSKAEDIHVFFARREGHLTLDSRLIHSGNGTKGDILVKGVVSNGGRADLEGMIRINPAGSGTESVLSEHVILLDGDSHASAKPQLEIANEDVSSSHSASVSPLDPSKVFYLMSRGFSREEASGIITRGFLSSAIERIDEDGFRDEITTRLIQGI